MVIFDILIDLMMRDAEYDRNYEKYAFQCHEERDMNDS